MVEGLPPDGALARAAAGHHWTQDTFHGAHVLDLLGELVTDFRNANRSEKSRQLPYPEPVWRPGDPSPKQRAEAEARELQEARQGYRRIVAIATPEHVVKG